MNYICTWFCADEKGEESIFPQTGHKSSSKQHQDIYWRCIVLFYATSKRFNKNERHLLFTNVKLLPFLDDRNVVDMLEHLQVEVVYTDFKYKTPKGYFGMFQNQFYEFSILEYISKNNNNPADTYMILDSDCIFLKPAAALFEAGEKNNGFLSFEDDCTTDLVIHGLSRKDMKVLYQSLLRKPIDTIPGYHLGEFFLANVKNIQIIFSEFLIVWAKMLVRFSLNLPKFNEEAQTLSYIYYKNGFKASLSRSLMKRIWTNPVFYRNVDESDMELVVWHLPSEKTYGLTDLYRMIINMLPDYGLNLTSHEYTNMTSKTLGIPYLSPLMKIKYYSSSYYRAISKRARKAPFISKLLESV